VEDVSAIGAGNGYQYLALRTNGDLFYLASVTQRPYGAVAIEPVLSTVIATLAYATRLGTALRTASDAELLIALGLQGAGSWFITSAEWSERFSATVRGLGGPCPRELHSAVQTTLGALRSKPTDTVQLLVDTLIASSRLLTIPTAVYERRVGAAEFARS
jgi:hypothetical protein